MGDVTKVAATENAAKEETVTTEAAAQVVNDVPKTDANANTSATNSTAATGEEENKEKEAEWVPDYKFKVRDNVMEFDKSLQGHVTKENHKILKELHEKAFGLDYAKERLNKYDAQFKEMDQSVQKLRRYEEVSSQLDLMLSKGDFTSFQKTLQIPDEVVMQRAMDILKAKEMSPEERQKFEMQELSQAQMYSLEQQNQNYQKQLMEHAVSQRQTQLDGLLTSPELAEVVKDFDARAGRPGAFKERVWGHGLNVWNTQKIDLSAEDAVKGFLDYAGIKLGQVANVNAQTTTVPPTVTTAPKETLPNINSNGKSPARKVYSSIEDLKKARENLSIG